MPETLLLSVLFGLTSMVAYGFANANSKTLSLEIGPAQTLFLRGLTMTVVLGLAAIPEARQIPSELGPVALTIILGIAGYVPVLAFTHGIRESRLGVVAPIAATAPLITVLLSFVFLSVRVSSLEWLAIGMVVAANVFVSIDFVNWRESNLLRLSSGIPFALVAAAGWGLFYFFLVPSTRSLGPWVAAFFAELGVVISAGLHVYGAKLPVSSRNLLRPAVVVNGLLGCVGTVAFTVGVRYFNVGIVAALSNSTALISILLGAYLFKERLHPKEKVAAGIMILGVCIISLINS